MLISSHRCRIKKQDLCKIWSKSQPRSKLGVENTEFLSNFMRVFFPTNQQQISPKICFSLNSSKTLANSFSPSIRPIHLYLSLSYTLQSYWQWKALLVLYQRDMEQNNRFIWILLCFLTFKYFYLNVKYQSPKYFKRIWNWLQTAQCS